MKNKILYLVILLIASDFAQAAQTVDGRIRTEIARTLTRIVGREVKGTSVRVQGVQASRSRVRIYASIGLSYYPFREENVRAMRDSVRMQLPPAYRKASVELYTDRREIAQLIPMACRTAVPKRRRDRPVPFVNRSARPLVRNLSLSAVPTRGLAGRHIALWQSHGRFFDQTRNTWRWQRVRLWETCEDLYTQSYVLPYLVPMLERAGAVVLLPRERDVQTAEVLADNDDPASYREECGAAAWQEGARGFAHFRESYRAGENPFRDGTTRRTTSVGGSSAESRAVWTADIPETGEYAVYVSYESTLQSVDDARYTVCHMGGCTTYAVNQTMGGGTWIYLGHFPLAAGRQEVVTLSNRSARAGRTVSADAVKIGGGYGNVARTVCDSLREPGREYPLETSGYPRFCEGARYWLQWAGFGEGVYSPKNHTDDYKDDYMARAHWVNALMGGSERLPDSAGLRIPVDMALAFHSDAGVRDGDETIGTLGIYYTRENKGRFSGGADRYRSRDLTDLVMTQIVADIRRTWEPGWNRRGLWNRAYYEARVPAVPTMLLELLSHQNFADMRLGSDPRFKFLVSRAIYKGILRYINSQYGLPHVVQPLPVRDFSLMLAEGDSVRLNWAPAVDSLEASAVPDGYMVYTRVDGGGFDNGRYTTRTSFVTRQQPGRIYSYRVAAVNDGGESFPSETLAACRMPDERGRVLIVNGFTRISAPVSSVCDSLAGFHRDEDGGVAHGCDISFVGAQQVFDRGMAGSDDETRALGACRHDFETDVLGGNTFDYPSLHGRSVAAAGYSFASASASAIGRDGVPEGYGAVDLVLGKQRTTTVGRGVRPADFPVFPAGLQKALRTYAEAGGALFVSGCYVAADIGNSEETRAFAREVLRYEPAGPQRPVRGRVRVTTGQPEFTRGEYRYADMLGPDRYSVEMPDVLTPAGEGAFTVMRYADDGRAAAVAGTSAAGERHRSFVAGFPFEALCDEAQRHRMMRDVLCFLMPEE